MATLEKTQCPSKSVPSLGPYPSKIGKEELLEVLDLWQFTPEIKQQITELVGTDRNFQGPHLFRYYNPRPSKVEALEQAMAKLIGAKHCLAVNSCTSALVCAYRALGIAAGVPGRGELFDCELNYPHILATIEALGYDGCFGLEYFPKLSDHGQSLRKNLEYLSNRPARNP